MALYSCVSLVKEISRLRYALLEMTEKGVSTRGDKHEYDKIRIERTSLLQVLLKINNST